MLIWALIVTVAILAVAARDWRKGLLAVLLIGVLQDVFRKMTPGVPSYYLLWSTAVYAIVAFTAFRSSGIPSLSALYLRDRALRMAIIVFLMLIVLQLINSLVRYGNLPIPVLGALFYLGPMAAMLIGAGFADSAQRIRLFISVYLWIFVPVCLTVYLSPLLASRFPVLQDVGAFVGKELLIYDVGTVLKSHPGMMRAGEIASWHAATCVVFLSILSIRTASQLRRLVNAMLIILMLGVIFLTGRRKMLGALTVFFALQWGMLIWYRLGLRNVSVALMALAVVAAGFTVAYQPSDDTSNYFQRGQSVYSSVGQRLEVVLDLMKSAVDRSEVIGLGAGSTSQGARYSHAAYGSHAGGAAEAGLGKLIVELSVFGFLLVLGIVALAALRVLRQIPMVRDLSPEMLLFDLSFIAFLIANVITFAVASQLFGDLFVLIVTGTVAGFVVRIHNAAVDERVRVVAVRQAAVTRTTAA